jgi:hypothetical protein
MNCVFDIKLNAPMNAYECVAYTGEWCEFCGEDNGGGKFCYECGQRKTDDDDEDQVEVDVEVEDDEEEDDDDEYDEYEGDDLFAALIAEANK